MSRPKDTPQQWRARLEERHPGFAEDARAMSQAEMARVYGMSTGHVSMCFRRLRETAEEMGVVSVLSAKHNATTSTAEEQRNEDAPTPKSDPWANRYKAVGK